MQCSDRQNRFGFRYAKVDSEERAGVLRTLKLMSDEKIKKKLLRLIGAYHLLTWKE